MSLPRYAILCFLLLFIACESPHDRISRLQTELLTALGERDYFEIKTGKQLARLPLPPSPELAQSRKLRVSEINLETHSFENEKLTDEDQKRLDQLCANLNEMVKRGDGAFFDPGKCVLNDDIRQKIEQGDLEYNNILLQKIPEYYAEVERRWQTPDPARARMAAERSLAVLDWLEKMGAASMPARLAVKDFICLCKSAVLEH